MDLAKSELTSTDDRIAACHSRVIDSLASQAATRECIRLTHLAIARSREHLEKPFEDPIR